MPIPTRLGIHRSTFVPGSLIPTLFSDLIGPLSPSLKPFHLPSGTWVSHQQTPPSPTSPEQSLVLPNWNLALCLRDTPSPAPSAGGRIPTHRTWRWGGALPCRVNSDDLVLRPEHLVSSHSYHSLIILIAVSPSLQGYPWLMSSQFQVTHRWCFRHLPPWNTFFTWLPGQHTYWFSSHPSDCSIYMSYNNFFFLNSSTSDCQNAWGLSPWTSPFY